jgi:hypothetical protein
MRERSIDCDQFAVGTTNAEGANSNTVFDFAKHNVRSHAVVPHRQNEKTHHRPALAVPTSTTDRHRPPTDRLRISLLLTSLMSSATVER